MESSDAVYYWGLVGTFSSKITHTASQWKTPNSNPTSPCAVLTGFKSMHADRDCNLRWVAVKRSLRDNLISHSAQRKTVLRAGNKCLFNIFPSLCKGQVLCQVLSNKTSANEKCNQIFFFVYCVLLVNIHVIRA